MLSSAQEVKTKRIHVFGAERWNCEVDISYTHIHITGGKHAYLCIFTKTAIAHTSSICLFGE